MSISALLSVLASGSLAALCAYAVGIGYTFIPPFPLSATLMALVFTWSVLLTSAVGLALAACPMSAKAAIGAGAFWLLLVVGNCNLVFLVIVAHYNAISWGILILSLPVLLLEIASGYLPALAYMTWSTQRDPASGARETSEVAQKAPAMSPDPRPASPAPSFDGFTDLFAHVSQHGCCEFPGLRRDVDGSLVASQRTFAQIFGVSLATINTRIWEAHKLGRLIVTRRSRETKIALPK